MLKLKPIVLASLAICLIVAACGGAQTAVPPTPAEDITQAAPTTAASDATQAPAATTAPSTDKVIIRFGQQGVADSLNPAAGVLYYSYRLYDLVYSTLVAENTKGEYVGDLADSWTQSDDGLTWTFKIKPNVTYSDGTPLTADDVAWVINTIHTDTEGWALLTSYTNGFKEATAIDPTTVQVTLDAPISNFLYRISVLYIIKKADFEGFKTATDLQGFPNENMIGSGPFMVANFDKDKGIAILDANPTFYGGQPKIDEVIFQQFDNNDALVQALKVGDIDATYEVPASAFATVKGFENVKAINSPSRFFDELIINTTADTNDPAPTGNPALKDPAVRLAIAQAINKQDLVDIVWQGLAHPEWSIISTNLANGFWHDPSVQDVPFSIEAANKTLEDAGYVKGSDGIRAKGDVRLEMRLQYDASSTEYARTADLLKDWFLQAGISVSPEAVDSDRLTELTTGVGDYDLVIWGWGADPDPDFMLSVFTTDQYVVGGWSDSGYHNPDYDQMYLDQQTAFKPEDRQKIVFQMQDMIQNDKPYIVLYNYDRLQAYRTDKFTNFLDNSASWTIASPLSLMQVEPIK